jgi:serine/threonine protein kinase, bacterial
MPHPSFRQLDTRAESEEVRVVERFGPYRLDELIGRGGMGEVYRAFDTVKERVVAVKRLPAELAADAEFKARFRHEVALAAQLAEPHIIPIHDYGEIDDQLFIDMRLVTGRSLATVISQDGPLPPARALNIVAQIARALDAAHAEELLHRDIKPSNVLITGVEDNEFAYLTDFGITRSTTIDINVTGQTVATLEYMAPERFGEHTIDHRADIYSLGCLLFETLTGTTPFAAETHPKIINDHLHREPPRASTRNPAIPAALDNVIIQALAKDPQHRQPTATALTNAARTTITPTTTPTARDIESVAVTGPSTAKPLTRTGSKQTPATTNDLPSRRGHIRRRVLAIVAVVMVVGAIGTVIIVKIGTSAPVDASRPVLANPSVIGTIPIGDKPVDVAFSPDGNRAYVTNLSNIVSVVDTHRSTVANTIVVGHPTQDLAVSPDGTRTYATCPEIKALLVINNSGGEVIAQIPVGDRPIAVAVNPDGSQVYVTNGGSGTVSVIGTTTNSVTAEIPVGGLPRGVSFDRDGRRAYVTDAVTATISAIDTARSTVVGTFSTGNGPDSVAVSPDGSRVYTTNADANTISVIDSRTGDQLATVAVDDDPGGLALMPDGRRLLSTNELADSVSIIDAETNRVVTSLSVGDNPDGLAISPNGRRAYVANIGSGTLSVIDTGLA